MHPRIRITLLIAVFALFLPLFVSPGAAVQARPAARQITITITEAQFTRYLRTVKTRDMKSIVADIIDGGIIVKIFTRFVDIPEYHENFGILIRDGKVVTEAGVVDIPGIGALGYADIQQVLPELIPLLDHDAALLNKFVLRQIQLRAGSRYTPESVTTGNDKVVIVVTR